MVFRLIQGFDTKEREGQPAGFADEFFQQRNLAVVLVIIKMNLRRWQVALFCLRDQSLGERMVEAVKMSLARTARQFI